MVLVLNKNSKKSDFDNFLKKAAKRKEKAVGFDPKKITSPVKSFVGIDPVKYQRKLRNEE